MEIAGPLNDVPALKLSHSSEATNADLLAQPCEVAVEWSDDGTTWTEACDSRFLLIRRRSDGTDQAGVTQFELPGWIWQLRKVVLYPGSAPLVDGKRAFLTTTAGAILQTFLAEAQARGVVPGVAWDFTPTLDSAGQSWSKILSIYYEPGMDALTCLINLAEQGVLDFRTSGRTVQLFNPDIELGRDLASGAAPVDLRYGRDIGEAPETGTLEDRASAVLVRGDNGFQITVSSSNHGPWGKWETYVGQGGVSDPGTAILLADAALARSGAERVQRTRSIVIGPDTRWLPWRDYRPGDRILAPGTNGVMESLRVRQMTVTRDAKGVLGGNVVLNDRLLEREIRLSRRAAGIVGGSTADGGSGAKPAPESPAPRTPAAPTGLLVNPAAYIDSSGFPQGQVSVSWNPVTQDTSGVALNVGGYEVYARVNDVGALWFLIALTEAGDTNATYSPLTVGQQYQFKVRAINLGKKGPFSSSVAVTIPDDADAPPVPTAPVLSTRLGVVHVEWDGVGVGSEPMPSDFARVRVWVQDPLAPGWSEIGYLESAGSIVVPGLPYGVDRKFAFSAIDYSGNESARSASATIQAVQLVSGDAADGSITTGNLVANAVTATKIAVGAIEASHIAANAVTADKLEAVLALATRIVAGNPAGARVEINATGLEAYDASSVQTVAVSSATGAVSIVGQLATGATGRRIIVNPAGSTDPEVRFMPGTGTNFARIYCDTDGAIVSVSGLNAGNNRRSVTWLRGDEYRMQIFDVTSSPNLGAGGYMFAKPAELEIGYNDPTPALNRFRFTQAAAEYRGMWTHSGAEAGLIMKSVTITIGTSLGTIAWSAPVMTSIPFAVVSLHYAGSGVVTTYMTARSTSGFTIRCDSSGAAGSATAMIWAWRA
ncbi:fibronectin type III domain-containing protein [Nonomuraea basaltis]|uniref:fibronectin type III domain-containing protein n=1 Tax=Nonomuraea basaltis TaxID=2495887 RepID=UPI00110C6095|nr:fibronectin type III domain-containing protein [Nonomuraea basaltis]TMR97526.1 hypothetical protein EJK15_17550 [Nonomuraea basaltis]